MRVCMSVYVHEYIYVPVHVCVRVCVTVCDEHMISNLLHYDWIISAFPSRTVSVSCKWKFIGVINNLQC
jgi:hypothetical protein